MFRQVFFVMACLLSLALTQGKPEGNNDGINFCHAYLCVYDGNTEAITKDQAVEIVKAGYDMKKFKPYLHLFFETFGENENNKLYPDKIRVKIEFRSESNTNGKKSTKILAGRPTGDVYGIEYNARSITASIRQISPSVIDPLPGSPAWRPLSCKHDKHNVYAADMYIDLNQLGQFANKDIVSTKGGKWHLPNTITATVSILVDSKPLKTFDLPVYVDSFPLHIDPPEIAF